MNQYIVTVTPVAEDGSAEPRSRMTVRVEIENGEPHVVEFNVRASTGADLASGALPQVDLERLAQAFALRTDDDGFVRHSGPAAPAPAPAAPAPVARAVRRGSTRAGGRRPVASTPGSPEPAAPAAKGGVIGARAYRRMPEPADLQRVYVEVGSIAGVAKHYGVPTHTAQGWIGRLRRLGLSLSDQPRAR